MPSRIAARGTTTVTKLKNNLTIVSFNVLSLRNKTDELRCLVLTENVDLIVIRDFYDTSNINFISEYNVVYLTEIVSTIEEVVSPFMSQATYSPTIEYQVTVMLNTCACE